MPVMQRGEHLAEHIEELIITGLPCDSWSAGVILFFPVDVPQLEKWIPVVEGLPQLSEILFRVATLLGSVDLRTSPGDDKSFSIDLRCFMHFPKTLNFGDAVFLFSFIDQ
jgi:hypothetical protein